MFIKKVLITLVLFTSLAWAGGPWYVDAVNGSDSNNCLAAGSGHACLTVAHAESLSSTNDTINIAPGTYRLTTGTSGTYTTLGGRITLKNGQTLHGSQVGGCVPTTSACTAHLSGSIQLTSGQILGPDGNGNYHVTGFTQQGGNGGYGCDTGGGSGGNGWPGCNYPEDLYVNRSVFQHMGNTISGTFTYSSVSGGTIAGTATCIATSINGGGASVIGTIPITSGAISGGSTVTVTTAGAGYTVPTTWTLSGGTVSNGCTGSPTMTTTGGGILTTGTLAAGTWWFDYANNTIYLPALLTPTYVGANTVEIGVLATPFNDNTNNVTIENLTFEEFAVQASTGGGIDPNYGQTAGSTQAINWVVQNDYITLNHSNGLRTAFGMQVLNNVMDTNGQLGIGGGLPAGNLPVTPSGLLVQGNTITNNNYAHYNPGFGAGGFKVGNTADAIIRGNIVNNNLGNGIHFDVNSINALIDGNTVTGNVDPAATGGGGTAIVVEISELGATIRNNLVDSQSNGQSFGVLSSTSSGVEAYCNVITESAGVNSPPWDVVAGPRGNFTTQPNFGQPIVSTGNYFHHNTIIWNTGTGKAGFGQFDMTNQPNFFANNTPPDYNTYHASSTGVLQFVYDSRNTAKTFANYQAEGADVHGTIDTVYKSGFPTVAITSPPDQSLVYGPVAINVNASDGSGINKVEFYVDWVLQLTSTIPPYTYAWVGTEGQHVVAAMAYSNAGVRNCNAVTLNNNTPQPPTNLNVVPTW